MKIGIFKVGRKIWFNHKKHSVGAGDYEPINIIRALANNNPQDQFFVMSRNDLDEVTATADLDSILDDKPPLFKYNNVFSRTGQEHCKTYHDVLNDDQWVDFRKELNEVTEDYYEKHKDMDAIVCICGPHSSKNTAMFTTHKLLCMISAFCNCQIRYLNKVAGKIPVAHILTDIKYFWIAHDLLDKAYPQKYISQQTEVEKSRISKCVKSEEDLTLFGRPPAVHEYSGIEKIYLYGKKKFDVSKLPEQLKIKDKKLRVVLNYRVDGKVDRYKLLMEYIGKPGEENYIDAEIYGKWPEELTANDSRFKGEMSYDRLTELMSKARATLVMPASPKWTTSKYLECWHGWSDDSCGSAAFFAGEYDVDGNALPLDDYMRINKDNFRQRLEEVMNDDAKWLEIMKKQYSRMTDDLYDGSFISKMIYRELGINS